MCMRRRCEEGSDERQQRGAAVGARMRFVCIASMPFARIPSLLCCTCCGGSPVALLLLCSRSRRKCGIPGKDGSDWGGGVYTLSMTFPEDYPNKPPKVSCAAQRASRTACAHRCTVA